MYCGCMCVRGRIYVRVLVPDTETFQVPHYKSLKGQACVCGRVCVPVQCYHFKTY